MRYAGVVISLASLSVCGFTANGVDQQTPALTAAIAASGWRFPATMYGWATWLAGSPKLHSKELV
jgi:hypothetical protein